MRIIVVNKSHGRTKHFNLSGWSRVLLCVSVLGLPMIAGFYIGSEFKRGEEKSGLLIDEMVQDWRDAIQRQQQQIADIKQQSKSQLTAMTLILAEQQARLLRMDALGERLTSMAKLDEGEFDFSRPPPVGGPESTELGEAYRPPSFMQELQQVADRVNDRQQQLATFAALMVERKLQEDTYVNGHPVKKGWISSHFGNRTDPFHGKVAHHSGVDFAGKLGSDIIAVAAGVVTYSGAQSSYGNMVEITHSREFKTRYAHNQANLVEVGDVVKKGQVIALMGTSGRSTGPHVHFEVYRHNRVTDPAAYINRNQ